LASYDLALLHPHELRRVSSATVFPEKASLTFAMCWYLRWYVLELVEKILLFINWLDRFSYPLSRTSAYYAFLSLKSSADSLFADARRLRR
jgi:hypothetical protein